MYWLSAGVSSSILCAGSVSLTVSGFEVGLIVALFPIATADVPAVVAGIASCQVVMTSALTRLFVTSFDATTFVTAACKVETTASANSSDSSFLPGWFCLNLHPFPNLHRPRTAFQHRNVLDPSLEAKRVPVGIGSPIIHMPPASSSSPT